MRNQYIAPSTLYYKDVKPYLETGDVMLFKTDSYLGKVAATFDPTPFFHIALVVVGPDGRIFLVEHDNSKTIKRDGTFFVDFETKMALYPNSNLAVLKINKPINNNLNFETVKNLFVKYLHKYTFQKNPLGWLRMIVHNKHYYNMVGENNKMLCIEQVSSMLKDLKVFKSDTNIHDISPSKYFNKKLPFNEGYSCEGPLQFQYEKPMAKGKKANKK